MPLLRPRSPFRPVRRRSLLRPLRPRARSLFEIKIGGGSRPTRPQASAFGAHMAREKAKEAAKKAAKEKRRKRLRKEQLERLRARVLEASKNPFSVENAAILMAEARRRRVKADGKRRRSKKIPASVKVAAKQVSKRDPRFALMPARPIHGGKKKSGRKSRSASRSRSRSRSRSPRSRRPKKGRKNRKR